MTTYDPGHISKLKFIVAGMHLSYVDNLDKSQINALKELWLLLEKEFRNPEKSVNSADETEISLASGYDNPDMILLRWLRAKKWNVQSAFQQCRDTIKWRQEWGVKELVARGETDLCTEEIRTGKSYFTGPDKAGRPISYVSVKDHIKGQFPPESTEKVTVYTMETGRKLLRPPHESVTVIFDMTGFGLKNMDYSHLKFLINLLENYYPESFALGLIINAPWIFNGCWYIIKPWLDPVVESKIHFINNLNDLTQFVDPSVLPKQLNGTQPDFQYIPPSEEELAKLAVIRNDHKGKLKAEEEHRKAAEKYLQATEKWVHGDDTDEILEERRQATQELRDAFEQLVPYVSTQTHYHRTGAIQEPIFEIVYQRIKENSQN
ncbi:unnamed protein product [Adineta ricciae]|uniref:CRAL-TRIO domain-containing protein n=1 Tax=Adineta ricciae TaxID=249248 RepID=A0A814HTC5_ADIRI|nr:unnamed protein product [Adineta ricciae]